MVQNEQASRNLAAVDVLQCGLAPRPTTSAAMDALLRSALLDSIYAEVGTTVRFTENLRVRTEVAGADIVSCHIDVTGLEVFEDVENLVSRPEVRAPDAEVVTQEEKAATVEDPETLRDVAHTEAGMLGRGTLTGNPVVFQGVPVVVTAEAARVPLDWLTFADGRLALAVSSNLPGRWRKPAAVTVRVEANPDDVVTAIMDAMRVVLNDLKGLTADGAKLKLKQRTPKQVVVDFQVRVRWKFLRPRLRFRTRLNIDQHFVLRLRQTSVTSSNPLLGVVLRFYRRRINDELSAPMDLKEAFDPATLRKLRIKASDSKLMVELEATL